MVAMMKEKGAFQKERVPLGRVEQVKALVNVVEDVKALRTYVEGLTEEQFAAFILLIKEFVKANPDKKIVIKADNSLTAEEGTPGDETVLAKERRERRAQLLAMLRERREKRK